MSQLKLLERRAREVGQIKLGRMIPTGNGRTRPSKLDWFELLRRNVAGEWVRDAKIHEIIGETPTSIRVVFFDPEPDKVFHSELALYRKRSGGAFCTGDQVTARLRLFQGDAVAFDQEGRLVCNRNTPDGNRNSFSLEAARPIAISQEDFTDYLNGMPELEFKRVADRDISYWQCMTQKVILDHIGCESMGCPLTQSDNPKCVCKPKGLLRVMLMDAPSFGAHHVFRTGSWNSVQSILATLEMVRERVGSLEGIPFNLKCQQENITSRDGKNLKVTVAHLEVIGSLSDALELAEAHAGRRLSLGRTQAALMPPKTIEQEVADAEDDFAPEFRPDLGEDIEDAEVEAIEEGPNLDDDMDQRVVLTDESVDGDATAVVVVGIDGEGNQQIESFNVIDPPIAPEGESQALPESPEFEL
jgi:hypothetical protein